MSQESEAQVQEALEFMQNFSLWLAQTAKSHESQQYRHQFDAALAVLRNKVLGHN